MKEYGLSEENRPLLMGKKDEEEYAATRKVILDFVRKYKSDEMDVYKNLPPAKLYFLQIKK